MSRTLSPSTGRVYGVRLVLDELEISRSTFYAAQARGRAQGLRANVVHEQRGAMRSFWRGSVRSWPSLPSWARGTARRGRSCERLGCVRRSHACCA